VTVLTQRSEVETFVSQAASSTRLSSPQMIIADCRIPGMEAEEILAAVRTVPAYQRLPILLFSALDEAEGQRRRVQCGATEFVHKPGELEAFMTAVAVMVHRWRGGNDSQDPGQEALIQR
jgi:DNA-binding response OmpR family regulator